MGISAEDRAFLTRFASLTLPKEEFRHADHVRLAWILLQETPLLAALLRFRVLLKAFAAHHAVPELYNETITCFYLLLIRERLDGSRDWEGFQLANPGLFGYPKALLETYYPGGTAFTERAKCAFLLPEPAPAEAA